MFELKYIDVRNFRCHEEFYFAPLPPGKGITALSGPNGAGKSSLLYAFVWALYGKTPSGVTIAGLRRGTNDVEVRVGFQHEGQHIDVARRIRGTKDSTSATITVDGMVVLETSSRGANEWIRDRLHMDSESFTTAFVIQQKEVESLMTAGNTERRKVIERLAGIEQLSAAVIAARSDLRAHQKILETSKPTTDVEDLTTQLGELDATINTSQVAIAENSEKQKILREQQIQLTDTIGVWTTKLHTYEQLIQRRHATQSEIASAEMLLNELPEPMDAADMEALHARHATLSSELQALEAEYQAQLLSEEKLTVLREQVETYRRDYDRSVLRADELDTQLRAVQDQIAASRALTGEIDANIHAIDTSNAELSQLQARLLDAESTVAKLHESHESPCCPTCDQPIPDSTELVARWQHTISELHQQKARIETALSVLHSERKDLSRRKHQADDIRQQYAILTDKAKEHSQVVERLAGQLVNARERLSDHEALMAASRPVQLTDIDRARTEAQEVSLQLLSASKSKHARERREQVQQSITIARQNLLRIDAALSDINVEEARRIVANAQADKNTTDEELSSSIAHAAVLSERVDQLTAQKDILNASLDKAHRELAAHQAALSVTEELRHTAISLEEFRTERIHRLAPDISEVASEILRDITDSVLTEVIFDENFSANISTADGSVRTYDQLSGGEAESTSLAVRLAISYVLAGNNAGLLFIDEALTAQDGNRRMRALNVLRSSGRQTIIINHAIEDQDMVDEIITLPGRLVGGGVAS